MLQAGRALYIITIFGLAVTGYTKTFGDLVASPLSQEICSRLPQSGIEQKIIPHGALWKKETIRQASLPTGYTAAVGWINVATAFPCEEESKASLVEIRAVRIMEQKDSQEKVIFEKKFDSTTRSGWSGALFQRQPYWFGPGEGKLGSVDVFTDQGLIINSRAIPHNIYHGWTDPRVVLERDARQYVELEVRITGSARVQMGMDYWRDMTSDYNGYDPYCQTSNNCEAWIGDWYGDTKGEFITIRSPHK